MRTIRAGLIACCLLSLSGCIHMVASMSNKPMDRHHGERTWGAFFEDQAIENKVRINLYRADPGFDKGHIKVVSYNGLVLIAGEVGSDSLKKQAGNIAERIRHVRKVYNELRVSGKSSMLARMNDAWLTTKIKMHLYFDGNTPGGRTKIVTVNGVVYIMGLLTKQEADAVTKDVQKVYGVQKIVKIVEYIDNP